MLEVQRLQLELARIDRKIQQARGQESGDVSGLAQRRAEVKREFDRAYGRVLEETGERAASGRVSSSEVCRHVRCGTNVVRTVPSASAEDNAVHGSRFA